MLVVAISAYFYGHRQGQAVIQAEWQAEKAEANAQAALAIKKAQDAAIATERRQAAQFRTVEAKLIADNRKVQDEKNALLDGFNKSGGLRLPSAKGTNNSNGLPEVATSASGNQPETICYLPEEFVRDLAAEAERADQITYQLTACQMILEEERK
jgi:type II secretory pathway pseudopilin PulG